MNSYNRSIDNDQKHQQDRKMKDGKESCAGLEEAKGMLADKLDALAATVREKTAGSEQHPKLASYGDEASEILQASAKYVRDFDYDQTEADVRDYITQNPGQSMMIAGGIGLLLGVVLRRR